MSTRRPARPAAPALNYWPLAVLAVVAALALALPGQVGELANTVGYAVCHRIPDRSFIIGGAQLPLCARDTGMFTAALATITVYMVVEPRRFANFPRFPYAFALIGLFLAWGFDGFNSYMLLATRQELLYAPQNWLRLVTGAGMGVSLGACVVALFNSAVWKPELISTQASVSSWREVGRLLLIAAGVVVVTLWQPAFLYGPLAALSALGAFGLLTIVNTLFVLLATKRQSAMDSWRQLQWPIAIGAFLTFNEIMLIVIARQALTASLGLPF